QSRYQAHDRAEISGTVQAAKSETSRAGPRASASRRQWTSWRPICGAGAAISAFAKRPTCWSLSRAGSGCDYALPFGVSLPCMQVIALARAGLLHQFPASFLVADTRPPFDRARLRAGAIEVAWRALGADAQNRVGETDP